MSVSNNSSKKIPLLENINPDMFKGYLTPEEFIKELTSQGIDVESEKFKQVLKEYTGLTSPTELQGNKLKYFRDQLPTFRDRIS